MDEQHVRERSEALCAALVAGDIEQATADFSAELRQHLGEVIALLPLPSTEASIESIARGGAGFNVILRLVGETDEVQIQARWKDRDGKATVIELSHLSQTASPGDDDQADGDQAEDATAAEPDLSTRVSHRA